MKKSGRYSIDIFGLSNDAHNFEFEYDDDFFSLFEASPTGKGKGTCLIDLQKTDSMLVLVFRLQGTVKLICDRSLDEFDYPVNVVQKIIYKYGAEEKELSENVFVILKNQQEINIANLMYEFISLEMPMKKLHPRFANEDSNDKLIYSSSKGDEKTTENDPRWDTLKKLKQKIR